MDLQLMDVERELLLDVLQGRLTELRGEIHHARVAEFKEQLQRREQVLRDLISKLQPES